MNKKIYKAKNLFLTLCLATSFWGYAQSNPLPLTKIEAEVTSNKEMKLSDYFKNFRIVKLSSDSVIGEIRRIRYENERIYISDGNSMFIFSNTGKLLYDFSKGDGTGCSGINDFVVSGDSIIVIDRVLRQLVIYNHSGELISIRNVEYWPRAISPMINSTYFIYCGNEYAPPQIQHKLRRIRNGQEDLLYLPVDENQGKYLHINSGHYFNICKGSTYFFEAYNDTVFESINGSDIKPAFIVDYNGKNAPSSFFERKYRDIREFNEAYNEANFARGIFSFAKFDKFLMFSSFFQRIEKLTVFDHINHLSNTYAMLKDDVVFKGLTLPVSEFSYHATEDHIIFPVDASNVVEWRKTYSPAEQFKEVVYATEKENNPILLIFDFKK